MEKFTKVVVESEQLKNFKADIKTTLSFVAKDKDTVLNKIKEMKTEDNYQIISIKEDIDGNKELSADQIIKSEKNKHSNMDSYEFYHLMRVEGYDGDVIKNAIGL
jgi:hypothetical protein